MSEKHQDKNLYQWHTDWSGAKKGPFKLFQFLYKLVIVGINLFRKCGTIIQKAFAKLQLHLILQKVITLF